MKIIKRGRIPPKTIRAISEAELKGQWECNICGTVIVFTRSDFEYGRIRASPEPQFDHRPQVEFACPVCWRQRIFTRRDTPTDTK